MSTWWGSLGAVPGDGERVGHTGVIVTLLVTVVSTRGGYVGVLWGEGEGVEVVVTW